jgi:hypothetical protein
VPIASLSPALALLSVHIDNVRGGSTLVIGQTGANDPLDLVQSGHGAPPTKLAGCLREANAAYASGQQETRWEEQRWGSGVKNHAILPSSVAAQPSASSVDINFATAQNQTKTETWSALRL